MRYYVDENCIGCGLCEGMCPEVFHMAETGVAVAIDEPISNEAFDKAELAMDECPPSAIHSVLKNMLGWLADSESSFLMKRKH